MAKKSVLVANPGPMRWMRPMAAALADAGLLRQYITSIADGDALREAARHMPAPLRTRIERELDLRPLPEGVPEDRVHRVARLTEAARVLALRAAIPPRLLERLVLFTSRRFDQGVARQVGPEDSAVISMWGHALDTFEAARKLGVRRFLDYPTAHPRALMDLIAEEVRLQPDYASTFLEGTVSQALLSRVEREFELADRIFVLSSFQRRTFVEAGVPEDKLITTPLGVELETFKPASRQGEDDAFNVLFVGQITQRKGISYLLEGFERAAIPNSRLTLIGAAIGDTSPWMHRPNVDHIPHLPFFRLPDVYTRADVYVLPSIVEGFPQTALQAMASGVPSIVSRNTFGDDVITDGHDGFVVAIRDADAIADRLRYLHMHRDERERMGAAARRRAEDFSWGRYGETIVRAVRSSV